MKPHPVLQARPLARLLPLAATLLLSACASHAERGPNVSNEPAASAEARANGRRLCLMQPPAEVDACLRRVEEDYVSREGMRRVEPAQPAAQ